MYSARDNKGHSKLCLTLIFKVIRWGQMKKFNICEIRGIELYEIDMQI